jgi:hypothetical protein
MRTRAARQALERSARAQHLPSSPGATSSRAARSPEARKQATELAAAKAPPPVTAYAGSANLEATREPRRGRGAIGALRGRRCARRVGRAAASAGLQPGDAVLDGGQRLAA